MFKILLLKFKLSLTESHCTNLDQENEAIRKQISVTEEKVEYGFEQFQQVNLFWSLN